MKTFNIKNMKNGWFIGDFMPSIYKNPFFEIAHHKHKAKSIANPHTHLVTTELTYIISGKMIVSGKKLSSGDFFLYEKKEISDVMFLENSELIVIRWPSIPSDKFEL